MMGYTLIEFLQVSEFQFASLNEDYKNEFLSLSNNRRKSSLHVIRGSGWWKNQNKEQNKEELVSKWMLVFWKNFNSMQTLFVSAHWRR